MPIMYFPLRLYFILLNWAASSYYILLKIDFYKSNKAFSFAFYINLSF
jgi:hypothetical protein